MFQNVRIIFHHQENCMRLAINTSLSGLEIVFVKCRESGIFTMIQHVFVICFSNNCLVFNIFLYLFAIVTALEKSFVRYFPISLNGKLFILLTILKNNSIYIFYLPSDFVFLILFLQFNLLLILINIIGILWYYFVIFIYILTSEFLWKRVIIITCICIVHICAHECRYPRRLGVVVTSTWNKS